MRNNAPSLIANGTIQPSSFVSLDTSADLSVIQATANSKIIGISQVGDDFPPGVGTGAQQAAVAGEQVQLFGLGDVTVIQVGTASGVTRGDYLKSNAQGSAVTSSSASDNVGAIALESGAAGEQVLCQIVLFLHN